VLSYHHELSESSANNLEKVKKVPLLKNNKGFLKESIIVPPRQAFSCGFNAECKRSGKWLRRGKTFQTCSRPNIEKMPDKKIQRASFKRPDINLSSYQKVTCYPE